MAFRIIRFLLFTGIVLLYTGLAYAQNSEASFSAAFGDYRTKNFSEKIFLHTDQSSYFTGEYIWFNIFHVDASFHKPLAWSRILYVDLLQADGKPVVQAKFSIGDSTHTGSLFLPATLSSGNYRLVAYTNWMKNYGSEYFFQQVIPVINPFIELPKQTEKPKNLYDVQFFPEGGNLVYGVENSIGFRVADQDGSGVESNGAIVNQQNDTIVHFSTLKFGLGRFKLTPKPDESYRAVIRDSRGDKTTHTLPAISRDGYAMEVTELQTKIKISVRAAVEETTAVYLLTHARQTNVYSDRQFFRSGEAVFILDKKALSTGVSHFTVFDEKGLPVCERLWFKKPEQSLKVRTTLSQPDFSTRQKAELTINLEEETEEWSNLSVTVSRPDSLDLPVQNISSYLMLTSDLSHHVEHPEYYFGEDSPALAAATNNLMLTHGWRRFTWKKVLGKTKAGFIPELGGQILTGTIRSASGAPVSSITAYLGFIGEPDNLFISRSDSLGKFLFEVRPGAGRKNLIMQINSRECAGCQIELDEPSETDSEYKFRKTQDFSLSKKSRDAIEQRSIHVQVHSLFHPATSKKMLIRHAPFYGDPDEKYLLDDYTRFPTLEEVMREYMPGVRVSKVRGHFQIKSMDRVNQKPFTGEALVLLDGVPVFDMDKLIEVDPLKIRQLDAVTKQYYLQAASFDGIVSMLSYNNDLAGFELPSSALVKNYRALEEHREFFTPVYETIVQKSSSIPDARYVLYRSPDGLALSGRKVTVSFYTSDITGKFKAVIQGITKTGKPGFATIAFDVR